MVGHKDLTTRKEGNRNPLPPASQDGFDAKENWRPSESVTPEADLSPETHAGPFAGVGPHTGPRGDESLRDAIVDRITRDADVNASQVEVDVHQGIVVLSGTVTTNKESGILTRLTEEVTGVKGVENRVDVRSK